MELQNKEQQGMLKLQEILESKRVVLKDHFSQFLAPEFLDIDVSNAEAVGEREEKLYGEYHNVVNKIAESDYIFEGEAVTTLKTLIAGDFEKIAKGVNETLQYISLCEAIEAAKKKITFKQNHVEYIGELFAKLTFKTLEEAKELKSLQATLKDTYNELYINQNEIKFVAEAVNAIQQKWTLGNLPDEDANTGDAQ